MKKLKFLFLTLLCFSLVSSNNNIKIITAGDNGADAPLVQYESTYSVSYYDDIVGLKGLDLLNGLATISQENHKTYNTYGQIRGGNAFSDEDPTNPNYMLDFYTEWQIPNAWDGGTTWNREHVWCQSLSGGLYSNTENSTTGAGGDIHHIRPLFSSINNSRSNTPYGYVEHSEENKQIDKTYGFTGCYLIGDVAFEPIDNVKGDVARILMYLYMHYSTEVSANIDFSKAGALDIKNIIYTVDKTTEAAWKLLLEWNEIDPVSTFEANRNNYCTSVTGLRNPFIDHPEFATMIWDSSYSGDGAIKDTVIETTKYLNLATNILTLNEGQTYQITPLTNLENPIYVYTSSDTSVATISNNGLITALKEGETKITVTSEELSASLTLTVQNNYTEETTSNPIYTVASNESVTVLNSINGTSVTYVQTYSGNSGQITSGNSATLTLSGYDDYKINGFILSMKSNTSKGAGSLEIKCGDTIVASKEDANFNSSTWYGAYSTTYVPITVSTNFVVGTNEDIIITISASVNSLYIESYEILCEKVEEDTLTEVKNNISNLETKAQLNFNYYYSFIEEAGKASISVSSTIESVYMKEATTNYAKLIGLDENIFNVTAEKGNPSNYPYINKKGYVTVYADRKSGDGNTFIISLKNEQSKINKINFTATNSQYLKVMNSSNIEINQNEDGTYFINDYQFKIKNNHYDITEGASNNNANISQIDIEYDIKTINYFDFSNFSMKFCAFIPNEYLQYIDSYGMTFLVDNHLTDVPVTTFTQEENGINFAIIIQNITEYNIEVCATPYVVINNEKIFLKSKTYSIETIVDQYLLESESLELTQTQIDVLNTFRATIVNV